MTVSRIYLGKMLNALIQVLPCPCLPLCLLQTTASSFCARVQGAVQCE